jgi:hypothetical protein
MTYIDHTESRIVTPGAGRVSVVVHSWDAFTSARLEWLYGECRRQTPQAQADLASWNKLGRREAA